MGHKGPAPLSWSFSQESPTIYKRLANTQKNIAAKWWRRLQQLPLSSAQGSSTTIAQRRTSPLLYKLSDPATRLLFFFIVFGLSSSGEPRAASQRAEPSPFSWHDLHRPHYPRKSPFTRLDCRSNNATSPGNKRAGLTRSKETPSKKKNAPFKP